MSSVWWWPWKISISQISITRNDSYVLSIDPSLVMGFSENMVDIPLNHTQMGWIIIFPPKNSHKSYIPLAHPECLNMLNPATSNSDLCSEKSGIAKVAAQSPHSPFGVRSLGCFCPATAGEVTFCFWESHARGTSTVYRCFLPILHLQQVFAEMFQWNGDFFQLACCTQEYRSPSFLSSSIWV